STGDFPSLEQAAWAAARMHSSIFCAERLRCRSGRRWLKKERGPSNGSSMNWRRYLKKKATRRSWLVGGNSRNSERTIPMRCSSTGDARGGLDDGVGNVPHNEVPHKFE